jgi:hypothetical protein
MNASIEALRACSEAAKNAGKEQKCTISVAAPERAEEIHALRMKEQAP